MRRIINPGSMLVVEQEENHVFQTSLPVAMYIRRSTMGQVKGKRSSDQSKYQQDEATEKKLRSKGFFDIRKISIDDGKSGQKIDREGTQELYRMIRNREVGAVAFFDASRLWRDTTHVWYNDFIQLIQKYHVPVITYARVFWPDSQSDMDALREEFTVAALQLRHYTHKMNPARLQSIELGQNYGGHSVPVGFIVVGAKGEKHYAPYEPHAALVRYLFRRFRELLGSLPRLVRELKDTNFKFPPFGPEVDPVPHLSLDYDGTGYPILTSGGLRSILTNPAYLGRYTFAKTEENEDGEREVVRTFINERAHDAIVDRYDFFYAFNRLSNTTLYGEPNEIKPQSNRRYGDVVDALLEGILHNDENTVYVTNLRGGMYAARSCDEGVPFGEHLGILMIPVKELDKEFSAIIKYLLVDLQNFRQEEIISEEAAVSPSPNGFETDIRIQVQEAQKKNAEQAKEYKKQLATVDDGIQGWELAKRIAVDEKSEPDIRKATQELKKLRSDRAEIEQKMGKT